MPVPLVDVRAQFAALRDDVLARIAEVVDSGVFILGPNVKAFEEEAAAYLGVPETVGVANGTDAIVLVARRHGHRPRRRGHLPGVHLLRDCRGDRPARRDARLRRHRPGHAQPRPRGRRRAGSRRGRRRSCPCTCSAGPRALDALAELGPPLIEDAAQAFGAGGVATTGVASTFSFFPTKNLFGLGDGGLCAFTDAELAERVRMLRFHGSKAKKTSSSSATTRASTSCRPPCCASSSRSSTGGTRSVARQPRGTRSSGSASSASCRPTSRATCSTCTSCGTPERERLAAALGEAEIASASYYVVPLHLQPALRFLGHAEGSLPETERAAADNLALPLWAGIGADVQERVVQTIREASRGWAVPR